MLLILVSIPLLFTSTLSSNRNTPNSSCHPCICHIKDGMVTANCTKRNLSFVPGELPRNITSLDLSFNHIENTTNLKQYKTLSSLNISFNELSSLPEESSFDLPHLQILVLHNNQLGKLSNDSFSSLPSLETLELQNNDLDLSTETYPEGLFRSQTKLKKLLLQGNSEGDSLGDEYPDRTLGDLTALEELHVDGILNATFGEGFRRMLALSNLTFDGHCNIRYITNQTFVNLPRLQFLNISNCNLLKIEIDALRPLQRIRILDLSDNLNLGVAEAARAAYGVENSSLRIVKANRLQLSRQPGILITRDDMKSLSQTHLEELHLDGNRIEFVDAKVPIYLPHTIKVLSVQRNAFYYGTYLLTLSSMTGLETLLFSHQHESHVRPFSSDVRSKRFFRSSRKRYGLHRHLLTGKNDHHWSGMSRLKDQHNITIPIPPNMTFCDASFSKLKFPLPKMTFASNKLKHMDASHNFFSRWEGPFFGLSRLEYFDLSDNFCDNVSDKFFSEFTSLRYLNVSSNFLAYTLTDHTFTNLHQLEILNLGNNKVQYLPRNIFQNLHKLTILNLTLNFMSSWTADAKPMSNLSTLDLSCNLFTEIPNEIRHFISDVSPVKELILKGNPLKCTCETLPSLKWIQDNKHRLVSFDDLSCQTGDNTVKSFTDLDEMVLDLNKECASYVGVMTGVLSVVVLCLGLLLTGLGYRYRWKLRYLYYLARMKHRGLLPQEEAEFEFDAFISYADEDRALVVGEMRTRLEDGHGLRLCIHHRDFTPGTYIVDNILTAVQTSRKTVIMLSKNFLKSQWCQYEFEIARVENIYTKRNTLLVVVLEDIPVRDLPPDIMELMRSESYVEYTEDEEGRQVFWQNLYQGITA